MSQARFCCVLALLASLPARATVFDLPSADAPLLGREERVVTSFQDTLYEIARRYSLGSEEIIRVNPGMDPWLPGAGKSVEIPGQRVLPSAPRDGIVVNLPEHRLYFYPPAKAGQPQRVYTYPVSIGKMDWQTPLGKTRVIDKRERPVWVPPESVRQEHIANGDPLPAVVPAGPDNPLGLFAMRLALPGGDYLIHGTNNPIAVGMAVTHGCIRMYPEDIAELFPMVPVGTPVYLINEPVKVAWVDGRLMLEVHPPVDAQGQTVEPDLSVFEGLLEQALGDSSVAIHWDKARAELKAARGVPTVVGLEAVNPLAKAPPGPVPAQAQLNAPANPL
ncbi:MAG TPA: L,D-transpeptidase family protein [Steroidobacteraceae bacterium]|nr:L,D-transpeptidase family protein [Steroidobacteraceae bacterium]